MVNSMLVLASQSKARRVMLEAAGLSIDARAAKIDEERLRMGWKAQGMGASDLAIALAEAKAQSVSQNSGASLVLGGDQILALEDGQMLDKPIDQADARAHLQRLSGQKHHLFSGAVIAQHGINIWQHVAVASFDDARAQR